MSYNETTKFSTADDILADDWYEVLGCNINSTQKEIDEAYHRLARQYHPDINADPSSLKKFYRINGAYQVLGDREIRAYYDYESGNANSITEFRFTAESDIDDFKEYIDRLTGYAISEQKFDDNLWDMINNKCINNRSDFKRNLNIIGTLDVTNKSLDTGIRTAFPVFHYKTCGVCRGFGKIGIDEREICYNCDGYGIEDERIFVYVEIPKKYRPDKLFKVPGRGHKVPAGIGDLIIRINPVSKFGLRTRMMHSALRNRGLKED